MCYWINNIDNADFCDCGFTNFPMRGARIFPGWCTYGSDAEIHLCMATGNKSR